MVAQHRVETVLMNSHLGRIIGPGNDARGLVLHENTLVRFVCTPTLADSTSNKQPSKRSTTQ